MNLRLLNMEKRISRSGNTYFVGDIMVNGDKLSYFYDSTDDFFNLFRGSKQDKLLPSWTPVKEYVLSQIEK